MRLGGPVFEEWDDPVSWVMAVRDAGYGAAFCPVETDADDETVSAYAGAAEEADIVIAEVPAFGCNPIACDEEEHAEAIQRCQARLMLAAAHRLHSGQAPQRQSGVKPPHSEIMFPRSLRSTGNVGA